MNRTRKTILRGIFVLALSVAGVFGAVSSAQAVEIIEDGVIPGGEVIDDDVFIGADNVVINGQVNGDVFAFGSTVTLNGVVNGSMFAGAQNVRVNGSVDGSLYVGASALDLGSDATVGRNVFFGGFSMSTDQGSDVGRDMLAAGYQTLLSGEVERDVKVSVAALELTGTVGGDVEAMVGDPTIAGQTPTFFGPPGAPPMVAQGIRVSSDAEIGGEIRYTSSVEQTAAINAAPEEGIVYSTPQPGEAGRPMEPERVDLGFIGWILDRIRDLITLLLLGGLALWLVPDLFNQIVDKARSQPAPATGWGLVTVIAGFLFLGGRWIIEKLTPQYAESMALPLVLGVVLYVALRAVPFFGWLLAVFVTLLGPGAMWLLFRDWRALTAATE